MNNRSKVGISLALAFAAITASGVAAAQTNKTIDNWQNPYGLTWKNGTNEHCWRNSFWTPATAAGVECGAPAPVAVAPAPAPAPAPARPVAPVPVSEKVTYAADAFFDFDKSVLKPEARSKLDELVAQVRNINLEVVIAVGHTDSIGTDAYNQRLSVRRAEAVKSYLVSRGIESNRVYTEGKGEKQPIADNKSAAGRAKNRRVEIEVVGTRGR